MISESNRDRKGPKKVKLGRLEALTAAKKHVEEQIQKGMSREEAVESGAKIVASNTGHSRAREKDALLDFLGDGLVGGNSEDDGLMGKA